MVEWLVGGCVLAGFVDWGVVVFYPGVGFEAVGAGADADFHLRVQSL